MLNSFLVVFQTLVGCVFSLPSNFVLQASTRECVFSYTGGATRTPAEVLALHTCSANSSFADVLS